MSSDVVAEQRGSPLILSLDTSSKRTSMAVARGDRLLAHFGAELDEKRSEQLWRELGVLLKEAGVALSDIDLFAACTGPGGFTGLRVGLAAIKGFAMAGGKSVAGVTSLEALAFSAFEEGSVLSLVSAYRQDYYFQLFKCERSGLPVATREPALAKPIEIAESLSGLESLVLIGVGAEEVLKTAEKSWAVKPEPDFLADIIARLAFLKFARGEVLGPGGLEAYYLRPADAEVKLSLGLVGRGLK